MSEATGKRERKTYQVRQGGSVVEDGKQARPAKQEPALAAAGDKAKGE